MALSAALLSTVMSACGGGADPSCIAGVYGPATGSACIAWNDCVDGEYVVEEGSDRSDRICAPCPAGTQGAGVNALSCALHAECSAGQYVSQSGSATEDQLCTGCTSGTYSEGINATECTAWMLCEAGSYVRVEGSAMGDRECADCAIGTYTSGVNQSLCVPNGSCAPGTRQTAAATADSPPVCEACTIGEHCPGGELGPEPCDFGDGTWDHDADPATACAPRSVCAAGNYISDEGDATADRGCSACASGSYSEGSNADACIPWVSCVAGQYASAEGSPSSDRACQTCPEDTFSVSANVASCTAWTVCVAGEFVGGLGSETRDRLCESCASGSHSSGTNTNLCGTWTDCVAGEYVSVPGAPTNDQVCEFCPTGTYTSGDNQSLCVDVGACAPGTVQTAAGTSTSAPECSACSGGEYCAGGTFAAVPCDDGDGSWDHDGDPATECVARTQCSAGSYVAIEGDADTDRVCMRCADGEYSESLNANTCTPWTQCIAGQYVMRSGGATEDRLCASCAPGEFSDVGNALSCALWSRCVPGQYVSSSAGATVDQSCAGCATGEYSTTDNAAGCDLWDDCLAGTFVSNSPSDTVSRMCTLCSSGTYSGSNNQSMCVPQGSCSAGTVETVAGSSTSAPTCEVCVAGEYCAGGSTAAAACTSGRWDHDADPATSCATQTDCGAGQYVTDPGSATLDRMCAPCTAGQYSATSNTLSCTDWSDCVAGQYMSTSGSASADRSCDPCTTGQYSDASNALTCTPWTSCTGGTVEGIPGTSTTDRSCVAPGPWVSQFGTTSDEEIYALALDGGGNVLVTGYSEGALPGQTNLGGADAFLRKYDGAGNVLWTRQFGTTVTDLGTAVAVDAGGNILVAGNTDGAFPGQTVTGDRDAFLRKYDSDGNELWTRQFGTLRRDGVHSVTVDGEGNVLLVGDTLGAFAGQSASGGFDAFLRKYDGAGNVLWTRQFGSSWRDEARSVSVDPSGNVWVSGFANNTLPGQSGTGAYLRKYNSAGDELWTRQFGTGRDSGVYNVAVDGSGNAFLVGATGMPLSGQTGIGATDVFIRKYDSAGGELWTRIFGSTTWDDPRSVAIDVSGNVLVAGFTSGVMPGQSNVGGEDGFMTGYDGSGNFLSTTQFGTAGNDQVYTLGVVGTGSAFVGGRTYGTLDGETAIGGRDAILLRVAL